MVYGFMKKEEGLSAKEAHKKLQQCGFNEIKESSIASPLKILLRQVKKNFIIYLLLVAMIISFFCWKDNYGIYSPCSYFCCYSSWFYPRISS